MLDADLAERIAEAGDAVAAGEHDDQFPVDVFQTGSGTSSNMNANEVIANLAGEGAHPNDHVNMGQSSNDVFPSAVHLAALDEVTHDLLPAMGALEAALEAEGEAVRRRRQGRPHPPDGRRPGHPRPGVRRLRGAGPARRPAGRGDAAPGRPDPARRHRHRHRPQHPPRVRRQGARAARRRHRPGRSPARSTAFEAQGNRDALVELSGALKVYAVSLNKIANDLALMGSGPRAGLAELRLPELQKGSSIMPGKVNPVIPEVVIQVAAQVIGNDAAITVAGSQGQFELNVRVPLIARNLLDSIKLLASASRLLNEKCVAGDRGQRGDDRAPRRGHPGNGHRPQPPHRLRPRRRHRQDGGRVRAARCARSPSSRASSLPCSRRRSTTGGWPGRTSRGCGRGRRGPPDTSRLWLDVECLGDPSRPPLPQLSSCDLARVVDQQLDVAVFRLRLRRSGRRTGGR